MRNPDRPSLIERDPRYKEVAVPLDGEPSPNVRDAEFLIRFDGTIFNIEGYYHPKGYVVAEVLYVPDERGNKTIFGQPYRKATLYPDTYDPIPYPRRPEIWRQIDPRLDQNRSNPFFARFKQILPASDFIAHLPSARGLERALSLPISASSHFHRDFENLMSLLGLKPEEILLGLTGALLLGNTVDYHDLDIVFSGSPEQNLRIAKIMRDLAKQEPARRIFEGGKSWQIRFANDFGILMCTFFTYPEKALAPLHDFSMEVLEEDITVEGTVSDDRHSMYTPTVLTLSDASVGQRDQLIERFTTLPLVVYHTASRGDCFSGDVVRASGALVNIRQSGHEFLAVCVIDREGARNLTPPWEGYYEKPS